MQEVDSLAPFRWRFAGRTLERDHLPLLMGILNVTPDSFSDGGQHNQIEDAVAFGLRLVNDGADILDVGGESTRPGSEFVSADEELNRTIPVIERLVSETDVPVSIDTTKAVVAEEAIRAGATIVNDISGLTFDAEMIEVCSHSDVGICLMHIRGTPKTMQENPEYEDVCREVVEFLCDGMRRCEAAGIDRERLCLDPGIGFGKTADHNMTLMRAIPRLRTELERPLLIGHSRKRFLSKVLGRDVEERTAGTIGVSIALAQLGADLLRVHDVRAVRDALVAWQSLSE